MDLAGRCRGDGFCSVSAVRRWSFEPGHTAIGFRGRHMMVTWVRGHFKDIHGAVDFDLDDCMSTTFEGRAETEKLWTGEPARDAHLRSADFFDVDNHPLLQFTGRLTERIGHGAFKGVADVTIRENTREVGVDVTYLGQWTTPYWEGDHNRGEMRRIGFEITGSIDRYDFDVSWNDQIPGGGVVASRKIELGIDVEAILDDDLRAVGLESAVYEPPA